MATRYFHGSYDDELNSAGAELSEGGSCEETCPNGLTKAAFTQDSA